MGISTFFNFLATNKVGFAVLILCSVALLFLITWLAWIFGLGRFQRIGDTSSVGYVLTDLFAKVVDDFRHLLALVIVLIFALALGYSLIIAGTDLKDMAAAIQAVVSTLGGLVGSIIGYYFGESAARRSASDEFGRLTGVEEAQQSEEIIESIEPRVIFTKGMA